MSREPRGGRMVELAADTVLVVVAFATAAWVLLLDVLCIGSCTDTPRAGAWTWLTLGAALAGTALLARGRPGAGGVLRAAPLVLGAAAPLGGCPREDVGAPPARRPAGVAAHERSSEPRRDQPARERGRQTRRPARAALP